MHNLFRILAFSWTILIFYFCLEEAPSVPKFTFQYKDKVVHFIFYFILVYFWTKSLKSIRLNYIQIILISAIVLGITIEVMQESFTVNRTFDWYDILANSIGALASFIYVNKFCTIKN
ncbi:MAG: VanZ family protein [Bacteroidota bacterium]